MWKERLKRVREAITKFTGDPRFKWYQRAVWVASALWAAVVVAQSFSYYTYIGSGKTALMNGQYQQAQEMFEAALREVKNSASYALIGERDGRYANALNNIAEVQRVTAHYRDAERNYLHVRELAAQRPGKKSEAYAVSTNNLAALYRDLARYAESEKLYNEAIGVWRDELKKTSDTKYAASLNGLAKLYRDEGRYPEAEKLYKQALDIRMKALGRDHQDVAEVVGNLGGLYRDEKRYDESEKAYLQAIDIDKRLLGETHPFVATDTNNLAGLYRDMHRYREAGELYKKALSMRQLTLGPKHPYCAKSWLGIAENIRQSRGGRNPECETALRNALQIDKEAFGVNHPDYATACDTAFNYYFQIGNIQLAQENNEIALEIRRKLLSPTHPDLLASLKNRDALLKRSDDLKLSMQDKK